MGEMMATREIKGTPDLHLLQRSQVEDHPATRRPERHDNERWQHPGRGPEPGRAFYTNH